MAVPRPEYPRPQFVREPWLCLNGDWQFEIDSADSGLERGLLGRQLADTITVPFCPESELSGIGNQDYLNAVWYRRQVRVPDDWRVGHISVPSTTPSETELTTEVPTIGVSVWVQTQPLVAHHRAR